MIITATSHGEFIVETGEVTADNRKITQRCFLSGNILRTSPGGFNLFNPIRITLGPISFAKVTSLKVGESVEVSQ